MISQVGLYLPLCLGILMNSALFYFFLLLWELDDVDHDFILAIIWMRELDLGVGAEIGLRE